VFILLSGPVLAADTDPADMPWEKMYLNLGYYFASIDSGFRLASGTIGIGVDVDVEDLLGLSTSESALRIEYGWRFTENMRHKLQLGWFRFDRSGSTDLGPTGVTLPDGEGGETTLTGVFLSDFNFDIVQVKYEYSFFLDERADFNIGIGLFVMPIEFGLSGTIDTGSGPIASSQLREDITAPLPVLGVGFDFAITPKWYVRQQLDIFYLAIGDFEGGIAHNSLALEWLPWKHVGFGVGVDSMRVKVEAKGSDYPGVDFVGNVKFTYFGAQLYVKVFY
jgi:hypothetical protein